VGPREENRRRPLRSGADSDPAADGTADGTADQLDPVANDHILASLIPGARLVLYPDAGHGFLFQEGTPFAAVIESFLTGHPSP